MGANIIQNKQVKHLEIHNNNVKSIIFEDGSISEAD